MNYEFDLEHWLPRFPLKDSSHYSGDIITSPCHICNNEWLRRGMSDQFDWGAPVNVDIFIHSVGEPANRFATKIGGLPYRPAKSPWPMTTQGRPMALIAQFNFTNSRDIVGGLPGDLLLVFGDDFNGPIEPLLFEWQNLGLSNLVSKLPADTMLISPCFGNRCRTVSYPHATQVASGDRYPKCAGIDVWSSYLIPQYQATQIGSAPFFIQEGDVNLPGTPLCTISSVCPHWNMPYPWVNHPEPLHPKDEWPKGASKDGNLMIGDTGCIFISIDENGKIHAGQSCY